MVIASATFGVDVLFLSLRLIIVFISLGVVFDVAQRFLVVSGLLSFLHRGLPGGGTTRALLRRRVSAHVLPLLRERLFIGPEM